MRHDRPVAAAVRGAEIAPAVRIVVVVIQIPLLARKNGLAASRAVHLARPDLWSPASAHLPMRFAVARNRYQNRGEKRVRARYSFSEKFTIQPPAPYLGPGLLLSPQMPDDLAEAPVD